MRKVISMVVLGVVAGSAVVAVGGCQTSGGEPYGVTGPSQMTPSERLKYTDQKGHYRPEFASRGEVIQPAAPD